VVQQLTSCALQWTPLLIACADCQTVSCSIQWMPHVGQGACSQSKHLHPMDRTLQPLTIAAHDSDAVSPTKYHSKFDHKAAHQHPSLT
jgi:hypothetical protein